MCRITALIALACLLLAACEASLLASPRVANTELAPLSSRTDHTLDPTLFEYGKMPTGTEGLSEDTSYYASLGAGLQNLRSRATSDRPASSVQSTNRILPAASSSVQGPTTADASRSPVSTIPPLSPIRTRVMGSTSGLSSVNTHQPGSTIPSAASPPSSGTHGSHTSASELRKPWPNRGPRRFGKSALDDDADSHEAKVKSKRLFPKRPSKLKRHSYVLRKKRRRSKLMKKPGSFKASRFANIFFGTSSDERESIHRRLFAPHQFSDDPSTHNEHDQGLKRTRSASTAGLWSLSSLSSALGSDNELEIGDSHNAGWQHFANEPSTAHEHDESLKRLRPTSTADTWSLSSLNSAGASDDDYLAGQPPQKKQKSGNPPATSFTSLPAKPSQLGRLSPEKKFGRLKAYKGSVSKITGGVKKPPLKMHRIFAHGMLKRAVPDETTSRNSERAELTLAPRYAKHPVKHMRMIWKAEAKRKSPVKVVHKVQGKKIAKKRGSNAIIVAPNLPPSRLMPMTKQERPRKPFQSYRASLDKLHKERTSPDIKKYHAKMNLLAKKLQIWKRGDSEAKGVVPSDGLSSKPAPRETLRHIAAAPVTMSRRDVDDEVLVTSALLPRVKQAGWKYVAHAINKHRRRRRPLHRVRDKTISKSKGISMPITAPNLPYSRMTPITKQQWPPQPFRSYRASLDRLRKTRAKENRLLRSLFEPPKEKIDRNNRFKPGIFVAKPRPKPGLVPMHATGIRLTTFPFVNPRVQSMKTPSSVTDKGKGVMISSSGSNPPRRARGSPWYKREDSQSGSLPSRLVG